VAIDFDVVCIGEALVDFLPDARGKRVRAVERWTRCSGGSPANVAIGLARLGAKVGFAGVVGDDEFGAFLREALSQEGIDLTWLRSTREARTGLAFIALSDTGERSFTFYRKPSAELLLNTQDVSRLDFKRTRVVHFGTNCHLYPSGAQAARVLARSARSAGSLVSFDPNLRLHLWEDPEALKQLIVELLPYTDVVKVAEDEVEFCTGVAEPQAGARALADLGPKLAIVTVGAKGAAYCWRGRVEVVPAPRVDVVDATGAGDGFVAGVLSRLTESVRAGESLPSLSDDVVQKAVERGCRVGAFAVTRFGAVAGLPRSADF
jgi:fructokinase